jgi:hypothetical protein
MLILVISLAFFVYCIYGQVQISDPAKKDKMKAQGDIVVRFVLPWFVLFVFMGVVQFLAFYMTNN